MAIRFHIIARLHYFLNWDGEYKSQYKIVNVFFYWKSNIGATYENHLYNIYLKKQRRYKTLIA